MSVVNLTVAKTHLNISVTTYDTEIQTFIDRAETALVKKVGPLSAVTTTKKVSGGGCSLSLPVTPAISLTSVTPIDGTALTVADLDVDDAGVVIYASGGSFPAARYTVVYQAGRASLPDDLVQAVLELVRHFWDTQRGSGGRPGGRQSEMLANTLPGAAYALPIRVLELIADHVQVP